MAADTGITAMTAQAICIMALMSLAVHSVGAIKCWECNSNYDKRCGDPFDGDSSAVVDCNQKQHEMHFLPKQANGSAYTATMCRKTYQTTNDITRVVRGCGWLPNEGTMEGRTCFSRTGTHQVMVEHCVCKNANPDEPCNSVSSLAPLLALVLTACIAAGLGRPL